MGLKTIYASLLILLREQPFSAINALPKSFFLPLKHVSILENVENGLSSLISIVGGHVKSFMIFRVKTSKKNSHNVTNHQKIIMFILMGQNK